MEAEEFENKIGKTLELEGVQLFWGRNFSKADIFFRSLGNFLKIVFRIIFFIVGVLGFLSFLNHLWLVQQNGISFLDPAAWQGRYLTYFWWSVIIDMYLFYSFSLDSSKALKVLKKTYKQKEFKKGKIKRLDIADSFTKDALKVIDKSYLKSLADNKVLDNYYLFNKLLKTKKAIVMFGRLGVPFKDLYQTSLKLFNRSIKIIETDVNSEVTKTLLLAYYFAYLEKRKKVEVTDLAKAIVTTNVTIQEVLLDYGITLDKLVNVVKWMNINKILLDKYKHYRAKAHYKPKGAMDRAMTALATPFLDSFSEDLTSLARAGYLPLTVAREKEFEEIYNVIEGGRNSVGLVGLPGVGKTNIIEGLANAMVAEEVPKILQDKRFVGLSISKLVAGASQPGILEQRLMVIAQEIIRARNVILHIDDIHNLVGVTSIGTENVELSEMFADFLTNKNIISITTTTPSDYSRYLENHPLGQVLQKIIIDEPDDNRAIQMVESKVGYIENKNKILFSYDALEKSVMLTRRFVPDHYLPEKAMKILEEVAIKVSQENRKVKMITGEDVAGVISSKTKIPLTQVTKDESKKLMNLEERIHQRMVNQDEAVNFVATALRRARAELRDAKRPITNLLFLGPTGVGKTELAKTVAQIYFGSEDNMIRLDMSEYQLNDSIKRLIGSRTTGQGGDLRSEGGVLTEAVRKKPFSLVLLDEIEKAHPDILNIFLQVMDDGRLTDTMGKTIDFSNTIIINTSNAGTQFLQDNLRQGKTLEEIKNQLMISELKQYFRPEFLNRFDGVVVFKPLSKEHIVKIAHLMLNKVKKRLENKNILLEVTPEAVKELAEAGFDPVFGARPLRRVIQERVDNALANYLLQGKIGRRDKVILEAGGKLRVEKATKF